MAIILSLLFVAQAFAFERDPGRHPGPQQPGVMQYAQRQYPQMQTAIYPAAQQIPQDYSHVYNADLQPSQYGRYHYNMGYNTATLLNQPLLYNAYDTRNQGWPAGKVAGGNLMPELNNLAGRLLQNYVATLQHPRMGKAVAPYLNHLEDVHEDPAHQHQSQQHQQASQQGERPNDPRVRRLPSKSRKKGSKEFTDSSRTNDDETASNELTHEIVEEEEHSAKSRVKKKGSDNEPNSMDDTMPEVEYEEVHEAGDEDSDPQQASQDPYHHLEDVPEQPAHQHQSQQHQQASQRGERPNDPRVRRLPSKSRNKGSKEFRESSRSNDDETASNESTHEIVEEEEYSAKSKLKKKGSDNKSDSVVSTMPEVEYEEVHYDQSWKERATRPKYNKYSRRK